MSLVYKEKTKDLKYKNKKMSREKKHYYSLPILYKKILIAISAFLLALFVASSFFFISPENKALRSEYRSTQLKLKKTTDVENETERIDYYDPDGNIAIAADLGYATRIITKTNKGQLESYYDAKGNPISSYLYYWAVSREYDKNDNIVRIVYLGSDNKPIMTYYGYAEERREYNNNNQIIKVTYYDTQGVPILTYSYGYGKINEYDGNGKKSRTIYIDEFGKPMKTELGYAIISYEYYPSENTENARIESEYYYDETENPVSLSLGQFGVHKEYNTDGLETVLTYLDQNGNPIVTNRGYTTVVRTFHVDNTIATEQYYDIEGNPFALSEGQYGKKTINGYTYYTNQNGREMINLRNLLYNMPWTVIILAMAAVTVSLYINRKWNIIFLAVYIVSILYLTVLFRENRGIKSTKVLDFYSRILTDSEARADIFKNIWLFIPLGTILYRLYPKFRILIIPIVFSILIEGIQCITGIGFCELDDIISNSIGGCIGFGTGALIKDINYVFSHKAISV